jgi:hypothetical protein
MLNISALQANQDHLMRTGFAIPMTTDLPSAHNTQTFTATCLHDAMLSLKSAQLDQSQFRLLSLESFDFGAWK